MTKSTIRDSQPTRGIFSTPFMDCIIRKAMAPPASEPNRAPAGTIRKITGTTNAPMMKMIPPTRCARTPVLNARSALPVLRNTGSMML